MIVTCNYSNSWWAKCVRRIFSVMIIMWRWCYIFHSCVVWLIVICWLYEFVNSWLEIFRMLWRCVILRWNGILFDNWCDNFLMNWRPKILWIWIFWRRWNDVWLRCEVFDRCSWNWCYGLNYFRLIDFFNDFHVSWLTSNNSVKSIFVIGSVLDNTFETFNELIIKLDSLNVDILKIVRKAIYPSGSKTS